MPNLQSFKKLSSTRWVVNDYGDTQPALETGTPFPSGHCEHLQGACLHAEVPGSGRQRKQSVTARRRGNLIERGEIASLPGGPVPTEGGAGRVSVARTISKSQFGKISGSGPGGDKAPTSIGGPNRGKTISFFL
jgi:hypothetical protein